MSKNSAQEQFVPAFKTMDNSIGSLIAPKKYSPRVFPAALKLA